MKKDDTMKRILSILSAALLLLCILSGCGASVPDSQPTSRNTEPTDSAPAATQEALTEPQPTTAVAQSVDFAAFLEELNAAYGIDDLRTITDPERYYGIRPEDVRQFCAQKHTSDAQFYEIILCEAASDEAVQRIETALYRRLDTLLNTAESYGSADDLAMLRQCDVTVNGNYVILIISPNAELYTDLLFRSSD